MGAGQEPESKYMTAPEVAGELLKVATRLTNLANELLEGRTKRDARALEIVVSGDDVVAPDRSVGRHGAVTEDIALMRAAELGEFTTAQFAYACGLAPVAGMHWISVLLGKGKLEREGVRYRCLSKAVLTSAVLEWIEQRPDKPWSVSQMARECHLDRWECDEALRALQARGTVRIVEINGYDMFELSKFEHHVGAVEVKRGAPVDHVGKGPSRLERSQHKHQHKLRKQRYNAQQEAKDKRAAEQAEKAKLERQQPPARGRRRSSSSKPVV